MTAVTLLTSAECGLCGQAKEALRRLAPELDLDVEVLDGEPFGFGRLSERKLRRELARRTARPAR